MWHFVNPVPANTRFQSLQLCDTSGDKVLGILLISDHHQYCVKLFLISDHHHHQHCVGLLISDHHHHQHCVGLLISDHHHHQHCAGLLLISDHHHHQHCAGLLLISDHHQHCAGLLLISDHHQCYVITAICFWHNDCFMQFWIRKLISHITDCLLSQTDSLCLTPFCMRRVILSVSLIHPTLAWATGYLTHVCDLPRVSAHRGPPCCFLHSHPKDFRRVCAESDSGEISGWAQSLAHNGHPYT